MQFHPFEADSNVFVGAIDTLVEEYSYCFLSKSIFVKKMQQLAAMLQNTTSF